MLFGFITTFVTSINAASTDCEQSSFSSTSNCDLENCCQKNCGFDECKKLTKVTPFICYNNKCPSNKKCVPYSEFDQIVEFYEKIPNFNILSKLYCKNDIKSLIKLASSRDSCEHYDAYNAFFYNADSHSGIYNFKFDSAFIQYFLVRFYYYLDLIYIQKTCRLSSNCVLQSNCNDPIDFLCPPCTFTNLSFESDQQALLLFNTITSDTLITENVLSFIRILLCQIKSNVCDKKDTTFGIYVNTLYQYFFRTYQIVEYNFQRKLDFINNTLHYGFFYIPYTYVNGVPTSEVQQTIINVPIDIISSNYLLAKFLK